jgi:hypothetical protein
MQEIISAAVCALEILDDETKVVTEDARAINNSVQ